MKRIAPWIVAALGAASLALAGCAGGDDDIAREAAPPSIGEAELATTDPEKNEVDLDSRGEDDGVVQGRPSLRAGDDTAPPPAAVGSARAACSGTDLAPAAVNMRDVSAATLCLLNAERAARRMQPLRDNALLARAAHGHARDMVAKRYFAHDAPSGVDFVARIKRTGYLRGVRSWSVGENLAWGAAGAAQPREIVQAWMASPGHRANVLNKTFREIGVGIVVGHPMDASPGATYATSFGTLFR